LPSFGHQKNSEIEEWRRRGPSVITFVVVLRGERYYAVGCYIPPTNLTTLEHVEAAWIKCPKGHIPILLGDLNIKLASPRKECNELIAEHVGNVISLVNVSRHFRQSCRAWAWVHWTWRMRQGGRWVSSQCDYFLRREINHRRFCNISLRMPSHHDSDHCAIIAKYYSGDEKKMKAHRQQRHHFLIKLPRGPPRELETLFEKLCVDIAPPPERERPKNRWISNGTWMLINHQAALRQAGKLNQCRSHVIGRQIKAALASNPKQRAADVGDNIKTLMAAKEVKEARHCLKGWYAMVEDRAPKASHYMLIQQTEERIALYSHAPPPGGPLPINVQPFIICNVIPSNLEIREMVREWRNRRAAGATGLQEKEQSIVGLGNKLCILVKLMQTIWELGCVPKQMTWGIIVLLPKGGDNYRGIGLLEPCWKAVEKIMVKQLASIKFHDCLHGGLPKRGTGTASIEAKLAQQLAWQDQCPLY
jgi:hypothetical protein